LSTGFERIGRDSRLQDHWIRRLIAFIIDSVIVGVGTLIIAGIILIPFILAAAVTGWPLVFNPFIGPFFVGILSVLYFALLESWFGWTFGKRLMNLRTMRLGGQRPSLDVALVRNISKIYWILVLLDVIIGLATPGDPRQKISDRMADTTVTSTSARLSPSAPP
jgi:uncharacterized RDD family membrane protein YckC